ncbi:Methyltransferase type 11 [Solidesulfovibrio fructosivorans JJ]]|uniref:Methyltransferase type 11 n=1 Tax=Solidesulfovibrio fructosivorans JJ] TaxID=596151 RepID=E1JWX7_SOLFR|nr:methyltransferase domain-containing protein [Solidesulfovibrio fructosivorans]EFL51181.1 Methyltransferase type 11 [Solidesulfovibrio fructosivorans JJ]]
MRTCHHCDSTTGKRRHPSSYDMQASQIVFAGLDLQPGDVFLDAGCGLGEYALEAARRVGPTGMVHAFDVNPGCIEDLASQAAALGLSHLHAAVVDITRPLPLADASITVGLLGTVLHIPAVTRAMATVFTEMRRVLRPDGRLGVVECNQHFFHGPPLPLRLAAGRITGELESCGFQPLGITDMGYNYLSLYRKSMP